jgi:hypothetical protein
MAEAALILSHRPSTDHTADDFTVGQRVKAHPATIRSCAGMCTGLSTTLVTIPRRRYVAATSQAPGAAWTTNVVLVGESRSVCVAPPRLSIRTSRQCQPI